MISFTAEIHTKTGLHSRPLAQFLAIANQYRSAIQVCKAGTEKWANGRSIMSLLGLGVGPGQAIEVRIEGEDEQALADALQTLIAANFNEEPTSPTDPQTGQG